MHDTNFIHCQIIEILAFCIYGKFFDIKGQAGLVIRAASNWMTTWELLNVKSIQLMTLSSVYYRTTETAGTWTWQLPHEHTLLEGKCWFLLRLSKSCQDVSRFLCLVRGVATSPAEEWSSAPSWIVGSLDTCCSSTLLTLGIRCSWDPQSCDKSFRVRLHLQPHTLSASRIDPS